MPQEIKLTLTVNSVIDNLDDAGLPDGDPEINIFTTEGTLVISERGKKLSFTEEDQLLVRMSEMPNEKIANVFLKEMNGTNPKLSSYMDMIEKRIGKNTANKRLIDTFAPKLVGARIGSDSYGRIMDEERERQKGSERTSRVINGIIDKLLRDDDGDDDGPFAFFGEIVDRIKLRIPQKGKTKEIAENEEREE